MYCRLPELLRNAAIGVILFAAYPCAMAVDFEFFESPSDDGLTPWNHPLNIATYDAWRARVIDLYGPTPSWFGEDWDGLAPWGDPWEDDDIFDIQDVPGAVFIDGVTFSNDLPEVPGRADRNAEAENTPGSSPAIDSFAWQAEDTDGQALIDFSTNLTDFLGFFIFDAGADDDDPITYNVQFSDDVGVQQVIGKETKGQFTEGGVLMGHYRFVGFVNTHPTAHIERFWVVAEDASRYGIDELEWGRPGIEVPAPATLWLLSVGVGFLLLGRRRFR
jgi:hypothetical protein